LFSRINGTIIKKLSTTNINDFYSISSIGRNMAVAAVLDNVAPFNITTIPNNAIFRYFFPSLAGRSISNGVRVITIFYIYFINLKEFLLKFCLEDCV
jgi:hypothetical protein